MENFSLLVRKKYEALDSEQKQMFNEEYKRRKKPFGDDSNNDLAIDVLRDIAMTFGNGNSISENKKIEIENEILRKNFGNTTYLPSNPKSKGGYNFFIMLALFIVFIGVAAYTTPTKVKMENDIINKFLETQPQFVKFFKNAFLGENVTEEKADNLIYNVLSSSGYKIYFKISNLGITKRLEIVDEISDKSLLVAYGFLGKTFITYKADDLVIDFNKNKSYHSDTSKSMPSDKIDYDQSKIIDSEANYKDPPNNYNKPDFYNKPTKEESKAPNLLRNREEHEYKLKSEPSEDSIKI